MGLSSENITQDYSKGYSSCLKETLQFLAVHSANNETQLKLLNHFQKPWAAAAKEVASPSAPSVQQLTPQKAVPKPSYTLWRPW